MKTLRTYFLTAVLAFAVSAASIQQAHALVPVIIYSVARQAAVMTAESVAVDVIARGAASTDPYVRTTATMGRKTFAARLAALRGTRWAGAGKLALALGVALGIDVLFDEEKGFTQSIPYDMSSPGYCYSPRGNYRTTLQNCLNLFNDFAPTTIARHENKQGSLYFYFSQFGAEQVGFIRDPIPLVPTQTPLTQEQVETALPELISNPSVTMGDYLEGLSQPQLAKLFEGAQIPYNPTSPTPQLEQWKKDYRQGLLQTTDPAAEHYVTPEQLQQVKDLIAAEDFAKTDDGTVAALNEQIKQPITQAQFEESNKKFADSVDSVTDSLSNKDTDMESIDDSFSDLDGIITDLPNTTLPAPADISVPQYVDCQQIHLSDGNGHELDFPSPSQCAKIETFKQGFGYFLAISVVFLLGMQLLTRPHG